MRRGLNPQAGGSGAYAGAEAAGARAGKAPLTERFHSGPRTAHVAGAAGKGTSLSMAEVHVQDGETLESALRRFKRKVLQEDIIKETKLHSFYLKPGEKKRVKAALARKRNRKKRTRDASADQAR